MIFFAKLAFFAMEFFCPDTNEKELVNKIEDCAWKIEWAKIVVVCCIESILDTAIELICIALENRSIVVVALIQKESEDMEKMYNGNVLRNRKKWKYIVWPVMQIGKHQKTHVQCAFSVFFFKFLFSPFEERQ